MYNKSGTQSSLISGGLPTFTPQAMARALVKERQPEETPRPERDNVAERRAPSTTTITIDLSTAFRGALALAEYLSRRQARLRADARELERKTLELANEYQGLVGVPDLMMRAECDRKQAEKCLSRLEKAQLCRFLCHYQDEAMYAFPGFLPKMWECDYCLNRLPVPARTPASVTCRCEGCGAIMNQKILD